MNKMGEKIKEERREREETHLINSCSIVRPIPHDTEGKREEEEGKR